MASLPFDQLAAMLRAKTFTCEHEDTVLDLVLAWWQTHSEGGGELFSLVKWEQISDDYLIHIY